VVTQRMINWCSEFQESKTS